MLGAVEGSASDPEMLRRASISRVPSCGVISGRGEAAGRAVGGASSGRTAYAAPCLQRLAGACTAAHVVPGQLFQSSWSTRVVPNTAQAFTWRERAGGGPLQRLQQAWSVLGRGCRCGVKQGHH